MKKKLGLIVSLTIAATVLLIGHVFAAAASAETYIGEARAQAIALEDAGVTEDQATFIKTHLDYDDGLVVYDVEFYSGNTEYDYEIDALSGDIREYDKDIEYFLIPTDSAGAAVGPESYIEEAAAKSIALEDAGVTEDQATFIKFHLDYDDGRVVYDVEFYSGSAEYDYEIDAVSGDILEHDREIEYYTASNAAAASGNGTAGQYIGKDKAVSIALLDAGLSETDVRKLKAKLDREHGQMVYEVEFKHERVEYEYEIDAASGALLSSDIEYDD